MVSLLDKARVSFLEKRLLLEEKRRNVRDKARKEKLEKEKKKANLTKLENELRRRIASEKKRGMTPSEIKRLQARKELIAQKKREVTKGIKNIAKTTGRTIIAIGDEIDKADKKRSATRKKVKSKAKKATKKYNKQVKAVKKKAKNSKKK